MFTNLIGGRRGTKSSRRAPQMVATAAAGSLALTMFTVVPVSATEVPDDLLNVGFAGSFSTEENHTKEYLLSEATHEKVAGKLERRSETVTIADKKAVFNGGFAGLTFTPTKENFLTDAAASERNAGANKGFRAEMIFTPEDNQRKEGTLFSAGGNFYVVHLHGKLRYGYSTYDKNANRQWVNNYREVDWPAANEKHVLQVTYAPESNEKMQVNLDGKALTPVTSELPFATHDQARQLIGFGHEVHPGVIRKDRGFKGSIEAIRVLPDDPAAKFAFKLVDPNAAQSSPEVSTPVAPADPPTEPADPPVPAPPAEGSETQPNPPSATPEAPAVGPETLNVTFDGTVADNAYAAGTGENLTGTLQAKPTGATFGDGKVALAGGTSGLTYALEGENPLSTASDGLSLDKPVRAEMLFTPSEDAQANLATLFSVGGNMFVRYQGDKLRYGFDSYVQGRQPREWVGHTQEIDKPEAGKPHLLQVEYLPTSNGTTMKVSVDGKQGPVVTADGNYSRMSGGAKTHVGFGLEVNPDANPPRGFKGSLEAIRLLPTNGAFKLEVPSEETTPAPETPEPPVPGENPQSTPAAETPEAGTQASVVEALNVAFGGSLVGTEQYTTTAGEIQHGLLRGMTGQEKRSPAKITLNGGRQGLKFDARDLTLGSNRINQSFLMEVAFTPKNGQVNMGTLMSAGGNFSVRYADNELSYGWDHNSPTSPNSWSKPRNGVKAPAVGKEHVFSIHYRVASNGTVKLDAMLDGEMLRTVDGEHAANISGGVAKTFGFGNDVHPQAGDRGFKGDITKVRVASTDGGATTHSMFKLQPKPNTEDLFRTSWAGSVNQGAYTVASEEVMLGAAELKGAARLDAGSLKTAEGADQAVFTGNEKAVEKLKSKGFIVETTFTSAGAQANQANIVNVGGQFFARYKGDKFEYGYMGANGQPVTREATFKPEEESHVLSLAYSEGEAGANVVAWLDRVKLEGMTNTDKMAAPAAELASKVSFGNELGSAPAKAFNGSFGESRFAALYGAHRPQDFVLQELDEICADMSHVKPGNYIDVSEADCKANIIKKAALVRPTEKQAVWQEEGLTAFLHYGINTYTPNNRGNIGIEWGHGHIQPNLFNPTENLDPDVWVRTLRDNGYRTAILVLKHHDGFMSWPTRYSDYSVKSSPWKGGKGDILREFTDAAHKYGMKVGVYISPADSHEESHGGRTHGNQSQRQARTIPTLVQNDDREGKIPQFYTYQATDYGAFFLNTLYEVLTEYGEIHEVWFDGATGNTERPEPYDYAAFYDLIHKLQPGANVAVGGRDIRWIGNEHGEARHNEWSTLPIVDGGEGKIDAHQPGGPFAQNFGSDEQLIDAVRAGAGVNKLHWWPAEADMKLTDGWFAHHDRNGRNTDRPKNAASLMRHYEQTVGRNSVMLLNVPPTTTGLFAPSSVDAIEAFAAERRKAFTQDFALGLPVTIGDTTTKELTDGNVRNGISRDIADLRPMEIDLGSPKPVKRIGISEDILDAGQVVKAFKVEAELAGKWTQVAGSGNIGSQRIINLRNAVTAQKFRITVTETRANYTISNFQLYGQLDTDPGLPRDAYLDCSAPTAGTGTADSPFNSLEQLRKHELAPGSDLYFKAGTRCEDTNITVWAYGTADDKVELKTWGDGAPATIGGKSLTERFAKYAAQGWNVGAPVEEPAGEISVGFPDGSAFDGSLKRGDAISITVGGLEPGAQIDLWIHSEPRLVASATANDEGVATLTWEVEGVPDGAHTFYAKPKGDTTTVLASLPVTVTGEKETNTGNTGATDGENNSGNTGNTGNTGTTDGSKPGETKPGATDGSKPGETKPGATDSGKPGETKPADTKAGAKPAGKQSTTSTKGKVLAATGASVGVILLAAFALSASGVTLLRRRQD